MLSDVLYYKDVFIQFEFADRRSYEYMFLISEEWDKVKMLFYVLKKFYDLTEFLSGILYLTVNLFYKGFCEISSLFGDWFISEDINIREMVIFMSKNLSNIGMKVMLFLLW